jgi:hypothetical protein
MIDPTNLDLDLVRRRTCRKFFSDILNPREKWTNNMYERARVGCVLKDEARGEQIRKIPESNVCIDH